MANQAAGPPSVATQLVMMAQQNYDVAMSATGVAYAIPKSKPRIARPLRGRSSLRAELAKQWFLSQNKTASGDALTEAITTLEGFAAELEPVTVHTRVARFGTELWLDLANEKGEAACISRNGWWITDEPPILFRRTALTNPLPRPEVSVSGLLPHLDVMRLFGHINVDTADWPLVIADLVAALDPDIPHPVVSITGEQGTAKTTASSILAALVDPSAAPTRKAPKDAEEWVVAASGSWRVAIDNIGRAGIPDWLSDSFCRAATGTGDVRRALYENDDIHVISFRRSVIINGITLGRMSEDLADRALPIRLLAIDPVNRKDDQQVWDTFNADHPRLLGALLDLAVEVLRIKDTVEPAHRPRMIDFARYLAAVDAILGTDGLGHYIEAKDEIAANTISDDPFIEALESWVTGLANKGSVTARASEILEGVTNHAAASAASMLVSWKPPMGWPQTAQGVGTKLTYMAPELRRLGWHVSEQRNSHTKRKVWSIVINNMAANKETDNNG